MRVDLPIRILRAKRNMRSYRQGPDIRRRHPEGRQRATGEPALGELRSAQRP